jgi:hypothetical protein
MRPTPPCAQCGNPVEMVVAEPIRFSNGVSSTAIVIEHPKQVTCLHCGATLRLVIVGIENIQMKTAKMPSEQPSLVVPASRIPRN